ncbi:class I SAM-dependent methyltransferase [Planctomyces sp. SH-PL62]|uniref:class I SAM-dependent methyltransferase n=1 Tax=Planctomyces sp. SH-PL62 TaxID=1636152 RepID=UPI00078B69C8|nr:class I SAM-dependent methyltransferase [Planctomyces sp. SH-PL62]AMV38193.1 Ubiquinone biosynthesis O-methyltransferase [Planctomyces sp. SH-PL62]
MIPAESEPQVRTGATPSPRELEAFFLQKHGKPETVGWAPRRRFRFGYFLPMDVYELVVGKCVDPGCNWLDVGGGRAIFPENPRLARELVSRCEKVVAVDPSDNVQRNDFVHERHQLMLQDFEAREQFDLATMQMVVEHVDQPESFVDALARLVKPGGTVVVFTVNRWSPLTLISWLVPFRFHHPIKHFFWGGEEEDTFPVAYRMNTRRTLSRLFGRSGFDEVDFLRLDDLSTFGGFKVMNLVELAAWSALKAVGLGYPENCLLGVYRRRAVDSTPDLS